MSNTRDSWSGLGDADLRKVRPSFIITAEEARNINVFMDSEIVFRLIEMKAKEGGTQVYIPSKRLSPETHTLLAEGGYCVRQGGVNNDQAVISWEE